MARRVRDAVGRPARRHAEQVWDAFTLHADAFLWEVEYEPREGGAERGLSSAGRHGHGLGPAARS